MIYKVSGQVTAATTSRELSFKDALTVRQVNLLVIGRHRSPGRHGSQSRIASTRCYLVPGTELGNKNPEENRYAETNHRVVLPYLTTG